MADQYPPTPAPQYQPPAQMQNGLGTAALVLGILSFFCLGTVGSILAIVFGKMGMTKAEQGLANNGGQAKAGFILGIIGVVLSVIALVVWIIIIAVAGSSSNY